MIYLPESDSEDELPPGWEERATIEGNVFYANHDTQSTQWTHPRTGKRKTVSGNLPFGWERRVLSDGKVLYVDHRNERTTFTDPRLAFAVEDNNDDIGFRQRFDASTRALQILHGMDLSDITAVVTGANSGIGYETARSLAYHGATVVFGCRNVEKAEAALLKLRQERPQHRCYCLKLDLSSLESVSDFVKAFRSREKSLDILVLNAGVFGIPFSLTKDGFETTFQVNFLSHLYLAYRLRPSLVAASSPKIVIVSSESHRFSSLAEKDVSSWTTSAISPVTRKNFFSIDAYNTSKFCLMTVGLEMDRLWAIMGIRTLIVHPGNCVSTGLSRSWWFYRLLFGFVRPFAKSTQQAAAPILFAAVSPEMKNVGGLYLNNCFPCRPHLATQSPQAREAIWKWAFEKIESVIDI